MLYVYDNKHRHHELWKNVMQSLVDDSKLTTIQMKIRSGDDWIDTKNNLDGTPSALWSENIEYRIKPERVKLVVNGVEYSYPRPFSGKVGFKQKYYMVHMLNSESDYSNYDEDTGEGHVAMGIVHLTPEAAKEHTEVLKKICAKNL